MLEVAAIPIRRIHHCDIIDNPKSHSPCCMYSDAVAALFRDFFSCAEGRLIYGRHIAVRPPEWCIPTNLDNRVARTASDGIFQLYLSCGISLQHGCAPCLSLERNRGPGTDKGDNFVPFVREDFYAGPAEPPVCADHQDFHIELPGY